MSGSQLMLQRYTNMKGSWSRLLITLFLTRDPLKNRIYLFFCRLIFILESKNKHWKPKQEALPGVLTVKVLPVIKVLLNEMIMVKFENK